MNQVDINKIYRPISSRKELSEITITKTSNANTKQNELITIRITSMTFKKKEGKVNCFLIEEILV